MNDFSLVRRPVSKQSHSGNSVYALTIIVSAVTDALRKSYKLRRAQLIVKSFMSCHPLEIGDFLPGAVDLLPLAQH